MSRLSKPWGALILFLVVFLLILACSLPITMNAPATTQPVYDPTKVALEYQATAMSLQLTQAALNAQPSPAAAQPTSPPPAATQPSLPQPPPPQISRPC